MSTILSRLVHKADITRLEQTNSSGWVSSNRVAVAHNVPCLITVDSASKAFQSGKSTEVETGTAVFLPDTDIRTEDTIQHNGRLLRVEAVRRAYHSTIGDETHRVAEWVQRDPEVEN